MSVPHILRDTLIRKAKIKHINHTFVRITIMEKRLFHILITMPLLAFMTCSFLNAATLEDLGRAIKDLNWEEAKVILQEKAHQFNKEELKQVKDLVMESVGVKIKKPLRYVMWYHNYKAIAKIGVGALGLAVSGRFIANALEANPEADVPAGTWIKRFFSGQPSASDVPVYTRSISSSLCLAEGAVGG